LVTTATVSTPISRAIRHDRCSTRAGAATHAGGDEQHVRALDHFGDAFPILDRRAATHFRIGARTQALGHVAAELHRDLGLVALECLRIGVGADELHPRHPVADHVVNGVAAAATNTNHLDYRFRLLCID
jgi:hypothetical protein